jgi:hypothetical protein
MGTARRTSTSELNEAGEQLLGSFYRGAWPAGMEPPPDGTDHVVIYNTKDRPPGEHWLCEYREGDTRLLYDSFGRIPSTQWQPRLQGTETTETDPEQPAVFEDGQKTEYCGQACLAFALVSKAYGYKIARAV